jgi:hypothetical protein
LRYIGTDPEIIRRSLQQETRWTATPDGTDLVCGSCALDYPA